MSDTVAARGSSSRGRGGFRGGRGGHRGGRVPSRSKRDDNLNDQENTPPTGASLDDQGEVGQLKRQYADKLPLLRGVFPDWSDEDLVFALQETHGDPDAAIDRISTGSISQWGEVKKKHPKAKDAGPSDSATGRGRGRGNFEPRGRGRGADRGQRAGRGARAGAAAAAVSQTNGTKPATTKTGDDGWGDTVPAPTNGDTAAAADWANDPGQDSLTSLQTEEPKPAAAAAPVTAPTKKAGGWASLFAKPPPAPKAAPVAQPEEHASVTASTGAPEAPVPDQSLQPPPIEPQIVEDSPSELPSAPHSATGDLPPGKDELTETNLEQLPDESHPPASQTVASTTASTQDPLSQAQAQSQASKPPIRPMSGYAATALKATSGAGRSASFSRKVMEQHEPVVMPNNHAVEKAAVQFGTMGLNGDGDLDVDEDREEPETRTQLPDDSPSAPRASLPPSHPESHTAPAPVDHHNSLEVQPTRQAPGLPPAPQQPAHSSGQPPAGFNDHRYGQAGKAYDPFAQPPSQPPSQQPSSQEPFSNQAPGQAQPASAQSDFASYYVRDAAAYQQYYAAQYAQSQGQVQAHGQDAQRTGSAFGTSSQEAQTQYATARPQQGYSQHEVQGSGQNTPAPNVPGHQNQHSQHMGSQGTHGTGYPYAYPAGAYNQQYPQYGNSYMNQQMTAAQHRYGSNRPMFDDARRQEDYYGSQGQQQQYGYAHNQQYGNSYKSNMYGQPQSQQQQYSYEHSSSPANATGFGGRDAGYGRSGSTQPSEVQQTGATAHGYSGMPDPFGRTASGFGQSQGLSQQHSGHQGSEDTGKPTGPSPSVQAGRPGSAVNNSQAQQGSYQPQSQHSSQQAFGGYPQYGSGFGNFGGQQNAHQTAAGYGQYGSNAFSSYGATGGGYGSGRGGWNH